MSEPADFFGYDFEADFMLFADEFEEVQGVYIIYTDEACLDIGTTTNLKESLETHSNTRDWVKTAGKKDVFVAIYKEDSESERQEIRDYLKDKMHPLF
jgi:predicted GIY-YIG superfamily endonuclease